MTSRFMKMLEMGCNIPVINRGLTISCFFGLGLSIYSFAVEQAVEKDPNYEALCDVGENMSCTAVFKSEYAKGFGIIGRILGKDHRLNQPNSLFGIVFYSLIATLAQVSTPFTTKVSFYGIVLSNAASCYFAYLLLFVLKDICFVCVLTYVVNGANLLFISAKHNHFEGVCGCHLKTKVKTK